MAFATKLFRIVLSNSYYQLPGRAVADFDIQPLSATAAWMRLRKIRMLHHADGVELVWLSEQYDEPLALLKSKAEGITLSFVLTAKNDDVFNYSELEVGYPQSKAYYFHNRHKHGSNWLHGDAFVKESDLMDVQAIAHYPTEPGWNAFGIVDIDFATWIDRCAKKGKKAFQAVVPPYEINIKNRSTIWRYCLIDSNNQLKAPIKVVAHGGTDAACFGAAQASAETPGTYWVASSAPIGLADRYDFFFSLCTATQSKTEPEKTVVERLPYPSHDVLSKNKANQKQYHSDVVVCI